MRTAAEWTRRTLRAIVLSSTFHLALLAGLILLAAAARNRVVETVVHPRMIATLEFAGGSHHVSIPLLPLPNAAHTRQPVPFTDSAAKTLLPLPKPPLKQSGGGTPPLPHKGDGTGQAARGNGADNRDVRPAFPVFSPRPPVTDRSLLPAAEEKIVVDVDVDELGRVVGEKLMKGMGNQLDQAVLEIVKTWRFQPATIDGKPVATEAELIFPFNQSYPITIS